MKTCFLIGYPVEHSLSPGMHRVIYDYLGLDWEYLKRGIPGTESLRDFIEEVKEKGYLGFNVTIPYKQSIMEYVDEVSEDAIRAGAVNTVINDSGLLKGYNTDWKGFLEDLRETLGVEPAGRKVFVLGCGGAARAVIEALRRVSEESGCCSEIFVYDILPSRADKLVSSGIEFPGLEAVRKEDIEKVLRRTEILVNASPAGMSEGDEPPLYLKGKKLHPDLAVYDLIYNRSTELLMEASDLGLRSAGGSGMLAGQGLEAFKLWYDRVLGREEEKMIKRKMMEYLRKEVL